MAAKGASISGLTEDEAKEVHGLYVQGFIGFTIVAIVAHVLVWSWRPWFPGVKGYAANLIDQAPAYAAHVVSYHA